MAENTMLAVVKEKSEPGVKLKQVPVPVAKDGEVLVKVKTASICGTDVGIYDWNIWAQQHIKPPIVIGHEIVGEVIEVKGENPKGLKKGDLVSSETHIFCGHCHQCKIGNRHICENIKLFGIDRNGSFAEYTTIPTITTWKNDTRIPLDAMSSQEPFGNAVHVVSEADVKDKTVLVMGLGPTGLCAVAAAKAFGAAKVIGINRREYRRNLAKEMGADEVYDEVPKDYFGAAEVVLEMSGNEEAIKTAFEAVAISGTVVIFGIPKKEITLDFGKYLIDRQLTVKGIFGRRIWETWEKVSELLVNGKVDLTKIVTHRFPLSDFEKAMEVMKSGECGKILILP